jgi:hypothetical protein
MPQAAMDSPPPIDLKTVRSIFWVCPHSSGDSFMLMKYASKDGLIVEYLWNSRDGVTPFMLLAKDGKTEMSHVDWNRDIYCPNYQPPVGMRIFVRLTRERAVEGARKNVERWWEDNNGFRERFPDKAEAIEHFAEAYESDYGDNCPDVITVTQEWLDAHQPPKVPLPPFMQE